MVNPAGIMLLSIGLALGPGYYVYSHFFSGTVASTHPVPIKHQAAGDSFDPLQIELTPDMGKVGLIFRFQAEHGPVMSPVQMPRNTYRAILKSGQQTVFDHAFTLSSTSVEAASMLNFSEAMPLFQATSGGLYQLQLSQTGEAGMNLISAEVQVRQGIVEPSSSVLAIGFGLLATGIALLLL